MHDREYWCGTLLHSWEGIHILCAHHQWHFYHTKEKQIPNHCVQWSATWYPGTEIYDHGQIFHDSLSLDGFYYNVSHCNNIQCYYDVINAHKYTEISVWYPENTYWRYFRIICRNGQWIVDTTVDTGQLKTTPKQSSGFNSLLLPFLFLFM